MTLGLGAAVRVLRIITAVSALVALGTISVGLTTGHWLYTEEKMLNPSFDKAGNRDFEFISKLTVSGLWSLCYTNPGETSSQCFNIDYFPAEEYSPDPNDSTLAIPYAVLLSGPFFFIATILLVTGEASAFFGHLAKDRKCCTFIAGISLILSGLFLLMGFVVYISVFTAEIGSKLRPASSLQPPLFTYRYGYSFHCTVIGFLAIEVAGTSSIFLFIYTHRRKPPRDESQRQRASYSTPSIPLGFCDTPDYSITVSPPNRTTRGKSRRYSRKVRSASVHHVPLFVCKSRLPDFDIPEPPLNLCPVHRVFTIHPRTRNFERGECRWPSSMPDITKSDFVPHQEPVQPRDFNCDIQQHIDSFIPLPRMCCKCRQEMHQHDSFDELTTDSPANEITYPQQPLIQTQLNPNYANFEPVHLCTRKRITPV